VRRDETTLTETLRCDETARSRAHARCLDTMKRIVTFLVPLGEGTSPVLNGSDGQFKTSQEERNPALGSPMPGTTRVEVIVSDEIADRVLKALLGNSHDGETPIAAEMTVDPVKALVSQELQDAGSSCNGLLDRIVTRVERQLIMQVYEDCDRVKSRAAIRLGINRNTLLKKLRRYNALTADEDETEEVELGSSACEDR
jgi:DNA-binding protein Fis